MTNPEIDEKRKKLNAHLGEVVEASFKVTEEMQGVRKERGIAHKSLKPQSGTYVVYSEKGGVHATYDHSNGKRYNIDISEVAK